jgi:hypothetical protein
MTGRLIAVAWPPGTAAPERPAGPGCPRGLAGRVHGAGR